MTEEKQKENYFVTLQTLKQKIKNRLSREINCTTVNCVTNCSLSYFKSSSLSHPLIVFLCLYADRTCEECACVC